MRRQTSREQPRIAMIGLRGIPASDGGVEVAVSELAPRLVELGADVTVYGRKLYQTSVERSEYRGVHIKIIPTINTKHLEAIVHTFLSTIHAIFQGYDLVHYHALGNSLFAWIPRLFGKVTVVTMHGLDWQREKWGFMAKTVLRLGELTAVYAPNRTIAVSRKITSYVNKRHGRKVLYIPNGFSSTDPEDTTRSDVIEKYALGRYVLFLGRLVPEKGVHVLIEAFSGLDSDCQLVIVGRGTHTSEYAEQLRMSASENHRIVFTGALFGADKEAMFNHALVFVLPSTIEGMPITLLEAMNHGVPCVVSDIQENREVVEGNDCRHAYLFKARNADDLKRVLREAIVNRDEAMAMAAGARKYVSDNFGWDKIARDTFAAYADVLSGRR